MLLSPANVHREYQCHLWWKQRVEDWRMLKVNQFIKRFGYVSSGVDRNHRLGSSAQTIKEKFAVFVTKSANNG